MSNRTDIQPSGDDVIFIDNTDIVDSRLSYVLRTVSVRIDRRENKAQIVITDKDDRKAMMGVFFSIDDLAAIRDFLNEHLVTATTTKHSIK